MNRLSFFFLLLYFANTNLILTMNRPEKHTLNSSYSLQDIINMIRTIDAQREELNAHILGNNHPNVEVMRARHKKHEQRSDELEIKFKQLENMVTQYSVLHGTHKLEQAYAQYKIDKQRAQDQIEIETLHKITMQKSPLHSILQKKSIPQVKIVHNVSFSDQSNISVPIPQLKRKRAYNKINSHYVVPYNLRKKRTQNKQLSDHGTSISSIHK